MNLGENIFAAFDVVAKMYDNVNKLMNYCRTAADENGEFVLATPKFLRWKSDTEPNGWYIYSFILLFQNTADQKLANKWRNGPVYVLEINLYNPDVYTEPMVNLAKYEYTDIESWAEGCSPANHHVFYHPLYGTFGEWIKFEQDGTNYAGEIIDKEANRFWGLRRITGVGIPLTEITRENAYEIIFGGFRSLIEK